jgi:hypothetical protein
MESSDGVRTCPPLLWVWLMVANGRAAARGHGVPAGLHDGTNR